MNTYKFKLWNEYKYWYLNNGFHRDYDRPAWINSDGSKVWRQHGENHRDNDKPAFIHSDGYKEWFKHGKYHRDNDKPARIWPDERVGYWIDSK